MFCGKLKGTVASETDVQMVGACWLSSVVCIEIRAVPILHHTKPGIGLSCGKMWVIWDWISRRQGKVKILALGELPLTNGHLGRASPCRHLFAGSLSDTCCVFREVLQGVGAFQSHPLVPYQCAQRAFLALAGKSEDTIARCLLFGHCQNGRMRPDALS